MHLYRCITAQCSFIWPGYVEEKWMHSYEFWFVLVCEGARKSKAVSFACSNANCSELMAKRNRDTCRLKKMKIWFSHSEPKRSVHSTVSGFFFFFFLLSSFYLWFVCNFFKWPLPFSPHWRWWREKTFSSGFGDLCFFSTQNFPIRFRCAIADR